MSFDSFNGRRNSRYRGSPDEDNQNFERRSGSRKRYRDNGSMNHASINNMHVGGRKNYDFYNSNGRFGHVNMRSNMLHRSGRRSFHGESGNRYRGNFNHRTNYIPSKRLRMDDRYMSDNDAPKPSRILGVFGLSSRTEERHLYSVMKKYGDVENVKILRDSLSTRSRGFGFIYFRDIDDACTAQRACSDGLELHGKLVRVDFSYTKGPHKPTPGVYMGRDKKRSEEIYPMMMGQCTDEFDSRRSSLYTNRSFNKTRSSQVFRARRLLNNATNRLYVKSRPVRSRSRSPVHFSRNRLLSKNHGSISGGSSSLGVRTYRPRSSRTDKQMHDLASYKLSRHSNQDLVGLDHSPSSQ